MEKEVRRSLPREQKVCPFANGLIVTVTSKNTGKTLMRWCESDKAADAFIACATYVADKDGQIWADAVSMDMLQGFEYCNYPELKGQFSEF